MPSPISIQKTAQNAQCEECGIVYTGCNVVIFEDGTRKTLCHKCLSKVENVITPKKMYVSLYLDRDLWTRFKKLCDENEYGYSNVVGELVREWVDDYEQ